MSRTIIVLLALSLSFVVAGCASKVMEYSPYDEHDDAPSAWTEEEVALDPLGEGVENNAAESAYPGKPTEEPTPAAKPVLKPVAEPVAAPAPKPEDPTYLAELKRRQLEKRRRAAVNKAHKELTGDQ